MQKRLRSHKVSHSRYTVLNKQTAILVVVIMVVADQGGNSKSKDVSFPFLVVIDIKGRKK